MAELSDVTTKESLKKQMCDYSTMFEMQADYLQDLKHHLEGLDAKKYADQLDVLNMAQRYLYAASSTMMADNAENARLAVHGVLVI